MAGELLVRLEPGISSQAVRTLHERVGAQVLDKIPAINVEVVGVPAGREEQVIQAYEANPNVDYAEPNYLYYASFRPNDPYVDQQWQLNNSGQAGGTPGADINAFNAWDVTMGRPLARIAILDTGIDSSHEDLRNKLSRNRNFTDSHTYDDLNGHGTHVAGSAGALTNNGRGVAGTCPNCTLFNVKVLNDEGAGAISWIARGITWAAGNRAVAINMSFGSPNPSQTLETAIDYAWEQGSVLVAAAGNAGTNEQFYPAAYDQVIAVGATDRNDQKPQWSNYGNWVDVAAPGAAILSTAPDHSNGIWGDGVGYGTISGTSMAAPHVSGVAGLVWTEACRVNECIRSQIELNSDPIQGTGTFWRYGRIDAYDSLTVSP